MFEGEWYIGAAIVQPLKEEISMKRRALVVITMCVLSVAVGISRISASRGEAATHGQTVAAAEKSGHKEKAPTIEAGGKKLLLYVKKYG